MKSVSVFSEILSSIADRGLSFLDLSRSGKRTESELCDLCAELISGRGEASGIAMAMEILNGYESLEAGAKTTFFQSLAERFGPDPDALSAAADTYLKDPSIEHAAALTEAAQPRRQKLIRRLNHAPDATYRLVAMREHLLSRIADAPVLRTVDADFAHLFTSWFNRGFLELRLIDWNTSAAILEKVIRYEAVHAISDWEALRGRIAPPDRRLYGFFHPRLGDEPLIFVEVALTREIPRSIGEILDPNRTVLDPSEARAAVFYSISNCQKGLRGVSFGNFLIKQVVQELQRDFTGLRNFATLSPLPGFVRWLSAHLHTGSETRNTLALAGWWQDGELSARLEQPIMALAARYLIGAKDSRDRPVDPVAQFHLGNGASLERINWLADTSPNGIAQAEGVMVNYVYKLDEIEANHEGYANRGEIATSNAVRRLERNAGDVISNTA